MLVKTLILDNFDSYTFNLYQLLGQINGGTTTATRDGIRSAALLFCMSHAPAAAWRNAWTCCLTCRAVAPVVLRNDEVDLEELRRLLSAGEFHNIVISPGPGTPSCAADIGETLKS